MLWSRVSRLPCEVDLLPAQCAPVSRYTLIRCHEFKSAGEGGKQREDLQRAAGLPSDLIGDDGSGTSVRRHSEAKEPSSDSTADGKQALSDASLLLCASSAIRAEMRAVYAFIGIDGLCRRAVGIGLWTWRSNCATVNLASPSLL